MKYFIFLSVFFWTLNTCSNAQTFQTIKSFTLIPLDKALKTLETQRNIHFAYDPNLCSKYSIKNWDNTKSIEVILETLLLETPFSLKKQDDKHFLIFTDQDKIKQLETNSTSIKKIQLNGSIHDYKTGEIIIGALIIVYPDGIISESDMNGNFSLNTVSKFSNPWIEIKYLGYQNQNIIPNEDNSQRKIKINLYPEISLLPPVTIKSLRPILNFERMDKSSKSIIQNLSYQLQANVFKDPMRLLQQSAGVNATDDRNSGLQIRGSGTDENLIKLNGLTLYNVDHFYGVFSNINPYIISSIDLYKSYFPANYGGRVSSVIQMKTSEHITNWNGGIELNLISGNIYLLAPISNKISLTVGVRTTTFNLGKSNTFNSILQNTSKTLDPLKLSDSSEVVAINPEFKFNDVYFNLNYNPNSKLKISTSYFSSMDATISKYNSNDLNSGKTVGNYSDTSNWNNQAYNISGAYSWNNLIRTEFNVSTSKIKFNQTISSRTRVNNFSLLENSKVYNSVINNNFSINTLFNSTISKLNIGIELNQFNSSAIIEFNRNRITQDSANKYEIAAYIQGDYYISNKFTLSPGFRLSQYKARNKLDLSPRFAMKYQWNSEWSSILNLGIYYQYLRQSRYEDRFGREYYLWIQTDEKKIPNLISKQFEFVQQFTKSNYSIKAELYSKLVEGLIENLVEVSFSSIPNESPKVRSNFLKGEGRYYGLDLTYEQRIKKYTYYFIYSYNNSQNSFPFIDNGNYYQKAYARTHQFKSNHTLNLKRWDFSINGVYGSSLPYNDVFFSGRPTRERRPQQQTKYLDDYFRVDIDAKYKILLTHSRLEFGVSILNLLDRKNTKYVQSLFTFPDQNTKPGNVDKYVVGAEVETLGRTLNLSIGYHF